MKNANQGNRLNDEKLLRIKADADLPSHKVAVSIDDLDRDILEMHQADVFFSYSDLAEKWDVTVATIRNRFKRLKASGVMDVILVMNPYKIGFNTFAIIGIKLGTGAIPEDIVSTLLGIPGVTNVVMVAGRYDFFFHVLTDIMDEYRQQIAGIHPLCLSEHGRIPAICCRATSKDPGDCER